MTVPSSPLAIVVGAGSLSAVGGTLAVQGAAVRAGLSRIFLHPDVEDPPPSSTRVSRASYFPDEGTDTDRLRAFLWAAVSEALERVIPLPSESLACRAWIRLPADRAPYDETLVDEMRRTFIEVAKMMQPRDVVVVNDGSMNALALLTQAQLFLASNPKHALAIVASCDSLVSDDAMDHLVLGRRLAREDRPWGMTPGEGAACLVLLHPESPLLRQLPGLAELMGVGVSGGGTQSSPTVPAGSDLTSALSLAVPNAAAPRFPAVFSDMNGERARSDDWSFSAPRISSKLSTELETITPASSQGDLGVATPLSLVALAVAFLASGWHLSDVLVATGGEGGMRGAAWLRRSGLATTKWFNRGRVKTRLNAHDESIVAELVAELSALVERKRNAVAQQANEGLPDWTATAPVERRIDRLIDALMICRDLGINAALAVLEAGETDGIYWGTRVLLQAHGGVPPQILAKTGLAKGNLLTPFLDACRHSFPGTGAAQIAQQFAAQPDWQAVAVALAGYAADESLRSLVVNAAASEPKTLGWILPFAFCRVCQSADISALGRWLSSDDPVILQASVFAWQYLDPGPAIDFVLSNARNVPLLLANTADARAVTSLLQDAETHRLRTSFYLALGLLGDPVSIPALLAGLDNEATVKEASAALALITGAELWESFEVERVSPDDELFADELERRKRGDKEVGVVRTQEVRMCQSATAWGQWLSESGRLSSGVRYRLGRPLDAKVAVEALTMPWVFPRLRVALANELGCVFGIRPFVEPDAPVLHQQIQLKAAHAQSLIAMGLPAGSWGMYSQVNGKAKG